MPRPSPPRRATARPLPHASLALAALLWALILPETAPAQGGERRPGRGRGRIAAQDLPSLQPAIDEAIDRGIEYLLSRQLRDGSWGDHAGDYGSGQTALSLYTLLESGLPPAHPAIQRGFAYVDGRTPDKTYTVACLLLAYHELRDPGRKERMKELLEMLLEWQEGSFSYPDPPESRGGMGPGPPDAPDPRGGMGPGPPDRPDLSNTQFAALGLRAARLAGLKVPHKAWSQLLEATYEYQEEPRSVPVRVAAGRTSSGVEEVAGFRYRPGGPMPPMGGGVGGPPGMPPGMEPTGSMTAAGIAVLEICRDGLGRRLGSRESLAIDRAQKRALAWLAGSFSVDRNPGGGAWLEYYLYGLERVGALLELDEIGGHTWYLEGARRLVIDQLETGEWPARDPESASCFALLFLQRATAPRTGPQLRSERVHVSEGAVRLRGTGSGTLAVWIDGFDEEVLREHGHGGRGPRVKEVVYLVDGKPVATVEGDPASGWEGEKYPTQHVFDRAGAHRVRALVRVVPGGQSPDTPAVELEADGFELVVEDVLSDWMLPCALDASRNLLGGQEVSVESSSASSSGSAKQAVDGLQSTAWVARSTDLQPSLSLAFGKPIRIDAITLGGADARPQDRGRYDAIARAEVVLDGRDPFTVRFSRDSLEPAVLRLDRTRSIRRLEVRILERIPRSGRTSAVGLAEIGLLRGRARGW